MKIIHKKETKLFKNSDVCDAFEYDLARADMGGVVVAVRGRHPDNGRVVNTECNEMAYILEGKGIISIEDVKMVFAAGDVILIEAQEKYFWDGNFSAVLFSVPAWNTGQFKIVD